MREWRLPGEVMRYLFIDPGGTTGWAFIEPRTATLVASGEADGFGTACKVMEIFVTRSAGIIIEAFDIDENTHKKTKQPQAMYLIGVAAYLSRVHGIHFEISARSNKAFATDTKLKKLGWWPRGNGHARDACRHGLTWSWDNGYQHLLAERILK